MTNNKRIHKYSQVLIFEGVGKRATIILEDGETVAFTTEVVKYDEKQEIIETKNSIYVPA